MVTPAKPFHSLVKICLNLPEQATDEEVFATLSRHPGQAEKPCLELRYCPYEALTPYPSPAWCENGSTQEARTRAIASRNGVIPGEPGEHLQSLLAQAKNEHDVRAFTHRVADEACLDLTRQAAEKTRNFFESLAEAPNKKAP